QSGPRTAPFGGRTMAKQVIWRGRYGHTYYQQRLDAEAHERGEWKYSTERVEVEGDVTVEVDLDLLMRRLATKALHSKVGKSVDAGGAIVVKAKNRKCTLRPLD